ncbi:MAG: TRAP transporter small permease subunit [Xanthomonadaceae bacterium]|jgi:TRAP-type C4-dicarboxylate transport system permease small subunit|nr:TRAP transporter small permease subunit [Xanthomonadaceae bacterium]
MHDRAPPGLLRFVDRAIAVIARVNRPLARGGRSAAGALVAGMLLLAIAQIVTRAVFDLTLDWAEELARFMLVWAVLLVAPFAYRSGAKVAISGLVQSLPPRLLLFTSIVLNLLAGWICLMLLVESIPFWQRGLALSASALPIQMAWIYAIVPLALLALVLVAVELVLRLCASAFRPDLDLRLVGSVASVDDD